MRKLLLFLTLLLMPFLSVYASGSVTVSKSSLTITTGSSATFKVTAKNAAGRIDVSSSNKSVATVNVSNAFLDNSSVTVKVTAKGEGTATINIALTDVATYDDPAVVLKGTKTVKITVKKPTPKAPTPVVKKEMQITNFEIVGYDIDFNLDNKEYAIDISKDVDSVYILVEGKNFTASGDKKVNIKDLTQTVVTLKDDVKTNNYVIKFNKKESKVETKTETKTIVKKVDDKKYFYLSIGLGALSFILLIICLGKKGNKKENYNSNNNYNRPPGVPATPGMRVTPATPGMMVTPATPGMRVTPATPGMQMQPQATPNNMGPAPAEHSKFVNDGTPQNETRVVQPQVSNVPAIDTPDFIEVK